MPPSKENNRSKKRKKADSAGAGGEAAAAADAGSCCSGLQPYEFHDYACAKAFDILSRGRGCTHNIPHCVSSYTSQSHPPTTQKYSGMYKKFLAQSNASGEAWAAKVMESVVNIQGTVSRIHSLVKDVQQRNASSEGSASDDGVDLHALAQACREVMDMSLPPRKRRHTSSTCSITGLHLAAEEGLEIMRRKETCAEASSRKKAGSRAAAGVDIVVHPRFMHFFSMLWLVCRVDHILRNMARAWMASSAVRNAAANAAAEDDESSPGVHPLQKKKGQRQGLLHEEKKEEVEGIGMCQKFSEHHAHTIEAMGTMFRHAASHVEKSLLLQLRT